MYEIRKLNIWKEKGSHSFTCEKIMIDELEVFAQYCIDAQLTGYTLSNED